MKVLIVNDFGAPVGGAERLSLVLRDGLRERGHRASLFASTAQPLPVPNQADYTCFGSERLQPLLQTANPSAYLRFRAALAEFRPDVVHVRMFLTQLSPLILPLLRDVPSLLHVVNYQTICPLNTRRLPDGSRCLRRAGTACYRERCVSLAGLGRTVAQLGLWRRWQGVFDLIVANSRWTMERLREQGIDVRAAVPNGMPAKPRRPPLANPPTIAFAGRLVHKKGVHLLLDAMPRIVAELADCQLIIAGDGPDRADVERRIALHGLARNVSLLGHLDAVELERRLAPAWVLAMPSAWDEPFGNAVIESMIRGTAVVAMNAGGPAETICHGHTGLLVPSGDVPRFASALLTLLRDRACAESMGDAARTVALAEYVEDRVIDRFLDLYRSILPATVAA